MEKQKRKNRKNKARAPGKPSEDQRAYKQSIDLPEDEYLEEAK
jgi:hypothetical protein